MFSQVKFHINYITKRLDLSKYMYLYRYTKLFTLNPIKVMEKILTQRSNSEKIDQI